MMDDPIEIGGEYSLPRIRRGMPEHNSWVHIIQRCTNPKNHKYPSYGGRGVTVCDRWRHSFPNFFQDMGPRPSKHHSIDRINNDGNYEPENCRWASPLQQSRNSTNPRAVVRSDGKIYRSLTDAANELGVKARDISDTCRGRHKTCRRYGFRYATIEEGGRADYGAIRTIVGPTYAMPPAPQKD